jgi:hypothetical protein
MSTLTHPAGKLVDIRVTELFQPDQFQKEHRDFTTLFVV